MIKVVFFFFIIAVTFIVKASFFDSLVLIAA